MKFIKKYKTTLILGGLGFAIIWYLHSNHALGLDSLAGIKQEEHPFFTLGHQLTALSQGGGHVCNIINPGCEQQARAAIVPSRYNYTVPYLGGYRQLPAGPSALPSLKSIGGIGVALAIGVVIVFVYLASKK